jgi:hypothetical protein
MSEYPTKSQIREWNNDGMDPDWKPENKVFISEPLDKLKTMINLCGDIAMAFENNEVKNHLNDDEYSTRVIKNNKFWREFLAAYNEVKFK